MAIDVTVLRVFTDPDGKYGNPLGVVDAGTVEPTDRQRIATQLGYSETIFIDLPQSGASTAHARIHTPAIELPFAGHPTVGASWWLQEQGTPVKTLQVPAGIVQVAYDRRADLGQCAFGMGAGVRDLRPRSQLTSFSRRTRTTTPTTSVTTCGPGPTRSRA